MRFASGFLAVLVCAGMAKGALNMFEFTGAITSVDDPDHALDGLLTANIPFSGRR